MSSLLNDENCIKMVCAILVTYEPDENLLYLNLASIASQVQQVLVVDNGSSQLVSWAEPLRQWPNVCLIRLDRNRGIAAAINIGIMHARKMDASYVLLLDQDSEASEYMVQDLLTLHEQLTQAGYPVSAVGPRFRDRSDGSMSTPIAYTFFRTTPSKHYLKSYPAIAVDFLISSGSLIALSTLGSVGLMREALFIDHVDTEWILRAQNYGYHAFKHASATLIHARGEYCKRIWFGRWWNIPMNKPFRYYYLFRNALLIMREKRISSKWKVMEAQRLMRVSVVVLLYAQQRRETFRYIGKGLWDGLFQRGGKLSDN